MNSFDSAADHGPLTWWGRVPVYAATWLVIAHTAGMILTALSGPLGYSRFLEHLTFSSQAVLTSGALWQAVTYSFISPPSLWFLVEMAMLYFFGREVEKYLGRPVFLSLYGTLTLLPPLLLLLMGLTGTSSVLFGSSTIHFAVFLAFACIHPNAPIFFGIAAKWVALALLALNSLMSVSAMDWKGLMVLWADCAAVVLILRSAGVHTMQFGMPSSMIPRRKQRSEKVPDLSRRSKPKKQVVIETDPVESIDPILEKIARSGIQSLTLAEKTRLEQARAALLHKEKNS
jgi:membrane associated rhomboid family serine protease